MAPNNNPAHLRAGQLAEENAEKLLESNGLKLLARNFRAKTGEIDLIMRDEHTIVFVEVRYRQSNQYGSGAESITFHKRQRIINTASIYLAYEKLGEEKCRFDVISASGPTNDGMMLDWIKNAFEQ